MKHKFLLLQKATVEDPDGALTPAGMNVAHQYAKHWIDDSVRDLTIERRFPQLAGLFYDIRNDAQLAREHSSEVVQKSGLSESIVMVRAEVQTIPLGRLVKAGGPYVGPRGGKWADPDHTIPWEESGPGKQPAAAEGTGEEPAGKQQEMFGEKPAAKPEAGAEKPVKMLEIKHQHVPLSKKPEHEGERTWVPHLPGLPEDTHRAYTLPGTDPAGRSQYIPERARMHDQIIADAMKGKTPVPQGQKPTAIVMMGGAASGKSTLVRKQFEEKGLLQNYVTVNSDDVKEQLPEYDMATKDPKNTAKDAAAMVHEESSHVAGKLLETAMNPQARHNLVFDGTGANARKYGSMINELKKNGYHVHLVYADVPNPDDAVRRAQDRANRTGRWVPEKHARAAHAAIPQNFEATAAAADSYGMYALEDGQPHKEVMSGQGGQHQIHNQEYLTQFRDRAAKLKTAEDQTKQQQGGGNPPSQPVAKSMRAGHTEDVVRKAFPPPPPQRFMMTRQAPGNQPPAAPPPGAQPGAPPARPPMMAQPPHPQAAPTPPPAPGQAPGAPPAAPMRTPDFNFDAFHRAVTEGKPEKPLGKPKAANPKDKAKAPPVAAKPQAPGKAGEAPDTEEDTTPFPEDDFSWAVAAMQRVGQPTPGTAAPAGPPAPPAGPPGAPPMAAKPPMAPAAPAAPGGQPAAQKPPFPPRQ